jgi:hypothetical protein
MLGQDTGKAKQEARRNSNSSSAGTENFTMFDQVLAPIAPLLITPDKLKLRPKDYAQLGIPAERVRKDRSINMMRYMIWRQRALRLAGFLGVIISIMVYEKFAEQVQALEDANHWCGNAIIDLGSVPNETLLGTTTPYMLTAQAGRFPSSSNYSNMAAPSCPAQVNDLMPAIMFPHSMQLKNEQSNNFCGLFERECIKVGIQNLDRDDFGSTPPGLSCSGDADLYCGRSRDTSKCTESALLDQHNDAACSTVFCRTDNGKCPVGSPCENMHYCGMDTYGEVCASSQAACSIQKRYKKALLQLSSDGHYQYSTDTYRTMDACQAEVKYHAQQYSDGSFGTGPLLRRSRLIGHAQMLGPQSRSGVRGQQMDATVDPTQTSWWDEFNAEEMGFAESLLYPMNRRNVEEAEVFYRPQNGFFRECQQRTSRQWEAQCSLPTGAWYGELVPSENLGLDAAIFDAVTPGLLMMSDDVHTLWVLDYEWQKAAKAAGGASYMWYPRKDVTTWTRKATCCVFPVGIAPSTAMEQSVALAYLHLEGMYTPTGNTFKGRPAYFGPNLGPSEAEGHGVYLFYWAASFKWVFGTQLPSPLMSVEDEASHMAQTALLTLRDDSFSADQIEPSMRWEVTAGAFDLVGMGCEDNNELFLSKVEEGLGKQEFTQSGVQSCADAAWLPAPFDCDTLGIAQNCRMVRVQRLFYSCELAVLFV